VPLRYLPNQYAGLEVGLVANLLGSYQSSSKQAATGTSWQHSGNISAGCRSESESENSHRQGPDEAVAISEDTYLSLALVSSHVVGLQAR